MASQLLASALLQPLVLQDLSEASEGAALLAQLRRQLSALRRVLRGLALQLLLQQPVAAT